MHAFFPALRNFVSICYKRERLSYFQENTEREYNIIGRLGCEHRAYNGVQTTSQNPL